MDSGIWQWDKSRMGGRESHRIGLLLFVVCLISFGVMLYSQVVSPAHCLHKGSSNVCAGVMVKWKCHHSRLLETFLFVR